MTSQWLCMQNILRVNFGVQQSYTSVYLLASRAGLPLKTARVGPIPPGRCDLFPREGDTSETRPRHRPAKKELGSHTACKQSFKGCKLKSSLNVWQLEPIDECFNSKILLEDE